MDGDRAQTKSHTIDVPTEQGAWPAAVLHCTHKHTTQHRLLVDEPPEEHGKDDTTPTSQYNYYWFPSVPEPLAYGAMALD